MKTCTIPVRCPDCNGKMKFEKAEKVGADGHYVLKMYYDCPKCNGGRR